MRRTLWGALVFWALLAPTLLYAFMAVGTMPAALVRGALGPAALSPVARIAIGGMSLAITIAALALVWWIWRLYRGEPPRAPALPSKGVLVAIGTILTGWFVAIQAVEPRGSTTAVSAPRLREPVSIRYPYEAEVAGREAVVEVSLWISASGEILRFELSGEPDPEFRAAVAEAVRQMRVDADELGAESYPYEKRLRIPFVRD